MSIPGVATKRFLFVIVFLIYLGTHAAAASSANDAPVANADIGLTHEDTAVDIPVLANDTDANGDSLAVTEVTQGTHGTVEITPPGVVRYTPGPDFHGSDSFTYTTSDGNGGAATAMVLLFVMPVNDAPVFTSAFITTNEDAASGGVTPSVVDADIATDGDTHTFRILVPPVFGTASVVTPGTAGTVRLAWDAQRSPYVAGYKLYVGQSRRDDTSVIDVGNRTTYAVSELDQGQTYHFAIAAYDLAGREGDLSEEVIYQIPEVGQLVYTPAANFYGIDVFFYQATDTAGASVTGAAMVFVNSVNDPPVAAAQSVTTTEDTPVEITLTGSDIDHDPLTYTIVAGPVRGTVSGLPPTLIYTPAADFQGTDSFAFRVGDGFLKSSPVTVGITVTTAELVNGGFEAGDFRAWTTIGETRIETAAFGSGPTEGAFQAFLSTAGPNQAADNAVGNAVPVSDLQSFLELPPGSLTDLSTHTAVEGTAIKRTFTAKAGDVLSFDWNFLTDENTNLDAPGGSPNPDANDLAFVTIVPVTLLDDTFSTFVLSSTSFVGETGFDTFSFTIPVTGTYRVGIGVVDVGDEKGHSGLLVDKVVLTPASGGSNP